MRVGIMQPTYLPWIGYLDLADQVEHFVFLDDASFAHRSWQQRNRIVSSQGLQWLTVPTRVKGRRGQAIHEVGIAQPEFIHKHLRAFEHAYRRAAFYDAFAPGLCRVFESGDPWERLADLNLALLRWLFDSFGIEVATSRSSAMKAGGRRGERLATLCGELGATTYLAAAGSEAYLLEDQETFSRRGVEVQIQCYEHPVYSQHGESFLPQASAIDLLFHHGPAARAILLRGRRDARRLGEAT